MRLVVTEKPSVARDIARVLGARTQGSGFIDGEGVRLTWCVGHLTELEDPGFYDPSWKRWSLDNLPMLPERFELRPRKGSRDQWEIVRRLLRDRGVTDVVNACDAGREGELIFRNVYELAGCGRPVRRLWISSMTPEAIRAGFGRLRPGEAYDPLADAARCRSEADWLVGLNATRALTCHARGAAQDGALLSVGRVQTPTLAMIVARDRAIEAFVPETYWTVAATFSAGTATWRAKWFQPGSPEPQDGPRGESPDAEAPTGERLPSVEHAAAVVAAVEGRFGEVRESERRTVRERPPLLYDLTSLQRRANQRYGMTADRTLAVAQALYERHKLITYPRTDARFLTEDQVPTLPDVVRGVGGLRVYAPFAQRLLEAPIRPGKRVVNPAEVGDHHAILPTGRTPDPGRLEPDEKRIFDLVARRLLAALSPDAVFDKTTLVVAVPEGEGRALPEALSWPLWFRARGRVCREQGWRAVDPPGRSRDSDLPNVPPGDPAEVVEVAATEGQTRPPRPHDDASLLKAMETAGKELDDDELARAMRGAGLGTPATRASILQTLIARRYVVRKAKALLATDRGCAVIDALAVEDLKSAELTGRWESRLTAMAEGQESRVAFMADVRAYTDRIVSAISASERPQIAVVAADQAPDLGPCPRCGKPVRERRAVYGCDGGRDCGFVVFRTMAKRKISTRMVRALVKEGRTPEVKGFRSKKGADFSAGLLVREDGTVGFWFPERRREEAPAAPAPSPRARRAVEGPVGMTCPVCGQGRIVAGKRAWGCDRWREGCRAVVPFDDAEGHLSDLEAVKRLRALARQ